MKKILIFLLFVLFLIFPSVSFADEGWSIESFKSAISIESTGTVAINELINVDFKALQKHGIYRDIPFVYTQNNSPYYTEVIVSQVLQDGQKAEIDTTKNDNNIRLRIGDPNRTISGKHTYKIEYLVKGVLLPYEDYDEFYWNVTGSEWGVPIQKASAEITVAVPVLKTACFQGVFGSTDTSCIANQPSEKTALFASSRILMPYEGLTIVVGYKKELSQLLQSHGRKLFLNK